MYKLFSAVPIVWRSPSCMQLGVDAPVLLEGLTQGDKDLLSLLKSGISEKDFFTHAESLGIPSGRVYRLLSLLSEAGALEPPHPTEGSLRPAHHVHAMSACLNLNPQEVAENLVNYTVAVIGSLRTHMERALELLGLPVRPCTQLEHIGGFKNPFVVLAGMWVPDILGGEYLVDQNINHLSLVIGEAQAEISHVVVPGVTPCISCTAKYRMAEDSDWASSWRSLWKQKPSPALGDPLLIDLAIANTAHRLRQFLVTQMDTEATLRITMPSAQLESIPAQFHHACDCRLPVSSGIPDVA